ncbi:hypothetical protein RGU12_00370 [Fredinandcohnia sp. QZ13]|uniref:hypothetical protein n=1 Tax=Fredinandcohnia sp. QZ13 TaxID=3073144 RepID=UPI002853603C|nr:hypothetical protein [Fredinandcohnia sp. QZ13]MDR4885998.1 hypothetical protein [Fredinandcohnia sp. QZ13]
MKKYSFAFLLLLIIVVVLINIYTYREQNLDELLDMDNVDKFHIVTEYKDSYEFKLSKIDQEAINKLAAYLNQYKVKLTNKDGWVSNYENERFELYLGYKNGEMEIYTLERDVIASNRVYKVLNAPLDYKWIKEFERDINSK